MKEHWSETQVLKSKFVAGWDRKTGEILTKCVSFYIGNRGLSQLFEEVCPPPRTIYLGRKVKIHEVIIILLSQLGGVAMNG